jgi:hypothetical protein
MSQKRFLDYGTTADASKTKVMHAQLFAPQVLRADAPMFSAVVPDQLLINPHAVMFDSGVILVEDEVTIKTIATTFNSANYTVYYEHVDEDLIGGVAAILRVAAGLLRAVSNGVVLGWVVYPGGSVPLANSMLYVNWRGQVVGGLAFDETTVWSNSDMSTAISGPSWVTLNYNALKFENIPGGLQVDFSGFFLSRNLAVAKQKIRVIHQDANVQFSRVTGAPGAGQYNVNGIGIITFNAADVGKRVAIVDMTYGQQCRIPINTDPVNPGYLDTTSTFPVKNLPVRTIFVEYVVVAGYTVDPVEILDINGDAAAYSITKQEFLNGQVSRLTIRLLDGVFYGTGGEAFVVRLRGALAPSGMGADLRVRASSYDLPV